VPETDYLLVSDAKTLRPDYGRFHPNDNSKTIELEQSDFAKFVEFLNILCKTV